MPKPATKKYQHSKGQTKAVFSPYQKPHGIAWREKRHFGCLLGSTLNLNIHFHMLFLKGVISENRLNEILEQLIEENYYEMLIEQATLVDIAVN